jgi:hypothetical protein
VIDPRAVVVTYSDYPSRLESIRRLRAQFPGIPFLTRGGHIPDHLCLTTHTK